MNRYELVPIFSILLACSTEKAEGPATTDGRSIALASTERGVLALDGDRGEIAIFDLEMGRLGAVAVGGEPTRIVRAGHHLFVTLRARRQVMVLSESAPDQPLQLFEETTIDVGAEPYGISVDPGGERAYVAASLAGEVVEIDVASRSVQRRWSIDGEPRYLAMHPNGTALFVGSALGGLVTRIDLEKDTLSAVPIRELLDPNAADGRLMPKRVSGDLAVSPDGKWLIVPLTYGSTEIIAPIVESYYGAGGGVATPVIGQVELDPEAMPTPFAPMVVLSGPGLGYATSVSFDVSRSRMLLTIEGRDVVAMIHSDPGRQQPEGRLDLAVLEAPAAPSGVVVSGDRAFVTGFVGRAVRSVEHSLAGLGGNGGGVHFQEEALDASPLSANVQSGRRLFFSSTDRRVTRSGASCAGCHIEGRCDGWTWTIEGKPRQTPALTERVSDRAPLRWEGDRTDIAHDAIETSKRMGANDGAGLSVGDAAAIAAFIDTIRPVDLPLRGSSDSAVARGRVIFERPDVACASCHSGALFTDKAKHNVHGEELKTPTLLGVASTPPYLHDGSVKTLEDLVGQFSRSGRMGNTAILSAQERADLVSYLKSL